MSVQILKESKQYLNKDNIHQIEPPLLGIDYGTKNIGIAITDRKGLVSTPLAIIRVNENNWGEFNKKIEQVIIDYEIKTIILGIPQEFEKSHIENTKNILKFKENLEQLTNLNIFLYDESYSTANSYAMLREQGENQKKSKQKIDKVASAYFLQELLEFKHTEDEK